MSSEPIAKTLERYEVLERIAVGGMAEVFLAKAFGTHGFEKTIAIKRILPELARDPEFEARFIAEAKVSVRLSHANVVQVLDFGRMGESLFIAMEYVDGLDLAAMLRKFRDADRQIPLPAAFHIAIEIARALDYAHQHNVVHRDVSPSNILISRAGEVKIADFGIAIAAQPHRGAPPGRSKIMGKWRYMSPEQARGDTLDTRSDLFSAASVMFELFTGHKLFPGDESPEIIQNIEGMAIPKLGSVRTGLPSRLDDVLAGPLARKPIDRPPRPAVVLRQLIELSYESSIMATALDVAEALATVLPPPAGTLAGALDDVIRRQIGESLDRPRTRRTAVTDSPPSAATAPDAMPVQPAENGEKIEKSESTDLVRKVDNDGLARLETAPGEITDLHALFASRDLERDIDRHTEVGGPPTGQVPKYDARSLAPGESQRIAKPRDAVPAPAPQVATAPIAAGGGGSRRGAVIAIAGVAIAGAGVAVWLATRAPAPPIAEPARDAAPVVVVAPPASPTAMDIDSRPSGATIWLDGKQLAAAGPQTIIVEPGKRHVRLELAGYESYENDYTVKPGATLEIDPVLTVAPAQLTIRTTPPGARATLGNELLGATPITGRVVASGTHVPLTLELAHYEPVHLTVDLKPGQTASIDQPLKPHGGAIAIEIQPYAEIFWNGTDLGRNKRMDGLNVYHLPAGKQTLQLVYQRGDVAKRKTVTATIAPDVTTRIDASFDD